MKYRLYVDEVGNPDMGASEDPNHRYLSLTGVILELGYVDAVVHPRVEDLKRRYFGSHADEPMILHRKELVKEISVGFTVVLKIFPSTRDVCPGVKDDGALIEGIRRVALNDDSHDATDELHEGREVREDTEHGRDG